MPVPVHQLGDDRAVPAVLDGHPTVFPPGERFSYNNGGYVVLALIAERASGVDFHELGAAAGPNRPGSPTPRSCAPTSSRAARDRLPDADGLRTNVFHLPVLGNGDGGIYSTAADLPASGARSSPVGSSRRTRRRDDPPAQRLARGAAPLRPRVPPPRTSDAVWLEGYDAGVSFCSSHHPTSGITYTVIANWSDGAWPMLRCSTST